MKSIGISVHIGFWLWYTMGVVFFPDPETVGDISYGGYVFKQASLYAVFIAYFYYVYILLVPKFLQERTLRAFILFVVLCLIGVAVGLGLLVAHAAVIQEVLDWPGFVDLRIENLSYFPSQFVMFTIASVLFRLAVDWFAERSKVESLESERQQSELAMLRSQIAPHFLFNSLNNIYFLIRTKSENAGDSVLKLADLMRYSLHRDRSNSSLADELQHVCNYIQLQKLRVASTCRVEVDIATVDTHITIEPLLLISFVENAFKHTDLTDEQAFIHVSAHVNDMERLTFVVRNAPVFSSNEESHGIGLRNVRRRLELVYPDRHSLTIEATEVYTAILEIQL